MTLLLTGASGFLGRHLAQALLARGDRVLAYKRAETNLSRLGATANCVQWFDLDAASLSKPFDEAGHIDAVIHLATRYGRTGESAAEMIDANTHLPVALYEQSKAAGVGLFLNTHTALPRNLSPYSLSKHHAADWLALILGSTQILHLRMEHFYGLGDDSAKFIEWLFCRLLTGEAVPLTKGEQQRDFLYIDDAVSATLTCLDQAKTAFAKNDMLDIGSGEGVTIRELAERCKALLRSSSVLDFGAMPYRSNEVMRSVADISRLEALGWKPKISLEEGLLRAAGPFLNQKGSWG